MTGVQTCALPIFYDWVGRNLGYGFAREYCTILSIPSECLARGYGDCGEAALVFITLCRLCGVPARFQSAWRVAPWKPGMHDWAEIYLPPWGWMPVDPYESVNWTSLAEDLAPHEREMIRAFHFGGLDGWRMVANRDHGMPLSPPKVHPRSDDVDSQRGEVEWEGGNLYYDAFDYKLEASEILIE